MLEGTGGRRARGDILVLNGANYFSDPAMKYAPPPMGKDGGQNTTRIDLVNLQ